jgi:hypothetical protein
MLTRDLIEQVRNVINEAEGTGRKVGRVDLQKITGAGQGDIRAALKVVEMETTEQSSDVEVQGLTADDFAGRPPGEIIDGLIRQQEKIERIVQKRYSQTIEVKDGKPIAVVFFADLHIGNKYTDYRLLKSDMDIIKQTPGMYCVGVGDLWDNWIGKLARMQAEQACNFADELSLLEWFVTELEPKWLALVLGNHGFRTVRQANVDILQRLLRNKKILYDQHGMRFRLSVGDASWKVKVQHKWPGLSQYNQTHPLEKDRVFYEDHDIAVGAHTHVGTLIRPNLYKNKLVYNIMVGTYKMDDDFAKQIGATKISPAGNRGNASLILYPDGRIQQSDDLVTAAEFLNYLRAK